MKFVYLGANRQLPFSLKTDGNGASITYAYDSRNRLTQKTFPSAATATFAYDLVGNMTSATDSDSALSFVYDNIYRLVETAQQIYAQPSYTISVTV